MLNDLGDDDDKYYDINEWVEHNYALIPQFWSKDRDKYLEYHYHSFGEDFIHLEL